MGRKTNLESNRRAFQFAATIAVVMLGLSVPLARSESVRGAVDERVQAALGVDAAVKIGLQSNPLIGAARAGVDAALASYRSLAALPALTLGATHVQGTSTAPTLTGATDDTFYDLSETIDTSGQRRYQAAGSYSQYDAARFQYQETVLTLEQQIRDAYWSLAAARAQTNIADIGLEEAQRVYALTVEQKTAGSSPRGDVVRSSIDVANAKQTLLAAQNADKSSLIAFNNLLARQPMAPVQLADDLNSAVVTEPTVAVPDLKEMNARAIANRPLFKSGEAQIRAATYAIRQAEAARFPDLGVSYQRSVRQPIDTVLLSLSFPIFDFGSVSESIRAAKKLRTQAEQQQKSTKSQIAQQVAQAYTDLSTALQAASSYRKEILDPSSTLLDMAQLGYKQGATGILPVIDAESTLRNARVGYISAILAIYKAQDEELAAVGPPSATPVPPKK